MRIRFTERALSQTTDLLAYIDDRSPQGAQKVRAHIHATIGRLAEHPYSGRAANRYDMRRILAHPYPYVIFYSVEPGQIIIHNVRHAARR